MAAPGSGVGELYSGVRALDVHVCAVARADLVAVAEGVNAPAKAVAQVAIPAFRHFDGNMGACGQDESGTHRERYDKGVGRWPPRPRWA